MPAPPAATRTTWTQAAEAVDRFARPVTRAMGILGCLAVFGLAVHVAAEVLVRTTTGQPFDGTIEYVTYWWMVPLVYFGLAVAQRHNEHTDMPVLYDRMVGSSRTTLATVGYILTAVFAGLIGWFGLENAIDQMSIGEYTGAAEVMIWPIRFAVPIGAIAFILELVSSALREADSPLTQTTTTAEDHA